MLNANARKKIKKFSDARGTINLLHICMSYKLMFHKVIEILIYYYRVKMALTTFITTSIYKYFIIKFITVLPFPPNYGLIELQPNHTE